MSKFIKSSTISFSIRNGLYMPFMYQGHQVVVHNAAWSFREKIWVDDRLVVNQLGFSMISSHQLAVAGDALTITFGYRRFMSEIFLEAKVGEEMIHEVKYRPRDSVRPATFIMVTIGLALAGAVFGYLIGDLVQRLAG